MNIRVEFGFGKTQDFEVTIDHELFDMIDTIEKEYLTRGQKP